MKTLIFDCAVGSEPTRILAALLDAGAREDRLQKMIGGLSWARDWTLVIERKTNSGLTGTCVSLRGRQAESHGYGFDHDHDADLPNTYGKGASVWGQMHEHETLVQGLLPECQRGFTRQEALAEAKKLVFSDACARVLERMITELSAMRQPVETGEIRRYEWLLMAGAVLLFESLEVEACYKTPVCVPGDMLSRVIFANLVHGDIALPRFQEAGLVIGYGYDGRESAVPDVLRACVGIR